MSAPENAIPAPELRTARLRLRGATDADVPDLVRGTNDEVIAESTLTIPYPYGEEDARAFLGRVRAGVAAGTAVGWVIERLSEPGIVGTVGVHNIDRTHGRAELGYVMYAPFRSKGYATEAARRVVRHAFEEMGLGRVHACVFSDNPASARVVERCGMRVEGVQRRHALRNGRAKDLVLYGVLREEWEALAPAERG